MALNEPLCRKQLTEIKRCAKQAQAIEKGLRRYDSALNKAWSATETKYLSRTIDALIERNKKLSRQLDDLYRDMEDAMEEILEEEAAAASEGVVI